MSGGEGCLARPVDRPHSSVSPGRNSSNIRCVILGTYCHPHPPREDENVIRNVSKLLPRPKPQTISKLWQASSGSRRSAEQGR
jgi:hypothetical protein